MVACDPDGRCCVVIMNDNLMTTMGVGMTTGAADQLHESPFGLSLSATRKTKSNDQADRSLDTNTNINGDTSQGFGKGHIFQRSTSPLVVSSYIKSLMVEHDIKEVLDFCFLNGYSEPVVLILYINTASWAGNLHKPDCRNSCCLKALSLNISRQHHPCIWSR